MTLIDEVMPSYDRHEVHRRAIDAPQSAIWDAVRGLNGDELRLTRMLMRLRSLGRWQGNGSRTVLDSFERMGFRMIAEEPGRELVVAGIGRFWKPSGGMRRVEDREQFTRFGSPGYAKVAFNFQIAAGELSTETRIAATDARARRRFGVYWLVVRPGSGLIRREWLQAIVARAEAAPVATPGYG